MSPLKYKDGQKATNSCLKTAKPGQKRPSIRQLYTNALLVILMLLFIGCAAPDSNGKPRATTWTVTDIEPKVTVTKTITAVEISSFPTPTPVSTATVPATATAAISPETPIPEPDLTPDEPINWEGQQLITLRNDGIYRLTLSTDELEMIASIAYREDEGTLSFGRISNDGKKVVYWFPDDDELQVWLINTMDGSSQQLLEIANDDFTRAEGEWHGQDRFFELGIRGRGEYGVPMTVQWYLFDMLEEGIVGTATDRPGMRVCHTLAISPESGQVATWCSFDPQLEEQRQYVVIEIDGNSWQTTVAPEQPLAITHELHEQIWSLERNTLLIPGGRNAIIVNIPEQRTYRLFNKDDIYTQTYNSRLSPDGRLLGYGYQICGEERFCTRLMDVESRTLLWESIGLFFPPPNVSWSSHIVGWSPDGKYFVVKGYESAFIISVDDYSVVKLLRPELILSIETVWLDN